MATRQAQVHCTRASGHLTAAFGRGPPQDRYIGTLVNTKPLEVPVEQQEQVHEAEP